jgi:S-adenosylmethionine decarboxylase
METGPLGTHTLIELHRCDAGLLNDEVRLRSVMLEAVRRSKAHIIKDVFHSFSPHGVTGVVVIAESHVAIHTWPEYSYAAVDVFSCSEKMSVETVVEYLRDHLRCQEIKMTKFKRGTGLRP